MIFEAAAYAAAGGAVTLFVGTELTWHRWKTRHNREADELARRRRLEGRLEEAREQRMRAWVDDLMAHSAEMAHRHRFVDNPPSAKPAELDAMPENVLAAGQNRQQRRAVARTCKREGHEPKWSPYKSWEILFCARCGVVEDGHLAAGDAK